MTVTRRARTSTATVHERAGRLALPFFIAVAGAWGCSDGSDGDVASSSSSTSAASPVRCIEPVESETLAGLSMDLSSDGTCDGTNDLLLRVRNKNAFVCSNDGSADIDDSALLFVSQNAEEPGAGKWVMAEAGQVATAPVSFPPGERQSPLEVADLGEGTHQLTMTITCEDMAYALTLRFTTDV